ncbi:MAG: hypothetical protein SFT92_05715 [Rickettsiales bacterium]|nr:hypothetical protein [Rickettsiales bacterium]
MGPTNYQQIAREFLDLWQKQVASTMNDKQFIQSMLELIQGFQHTGNHAKTATAASHTADAPGHEPGVLAELTFRLAMCERRLAELEKQSKKSPAKGAKRSAPSRSSKPRK